MKNVKWSDYEDLMLKNNYRQGEKEFILSLLNRSWAAIETRASKLGIKREVVEIKGKKINIWNQKEIDIIINNYSIKDKNYLLEALPKRTWSSIQNKAHILKLESRACYGDLSVLLNDNEETYYWIGFLMADGHFSKNGCLQINLSKKDLNHLINLSKFLKYKKTLTKPTLYISNEKLINEIKKKFEIKNNKTCFPCNITNIKNEKLLFSLIIGFIDGDGSIKSSKGRTGLYIKCHQSWKENLQIFINLLCKNENKKYEVRINKEGLSVGWITDLIILKNIKNRAINLKLPILERKWKNIDLDKKNKKEISNAIQKKCFMYFDEGLLPKDVVKKQENSHSVIYKNYDIWIKK